MIFWLPEKVADDRRGDNRRKPVGNVKAEAVQKHYYSQEQKRIHRAVFKEYVFFYFIYVADGQFPDNKRAQAVAEQDKGHGHSESERAQDTVYGKSGVYHFQIKYFSRVGKSFA